MPRPLTHVFEAKARNFTLYRPPVGRRILGNGEAVYKDNVHQATDIYTFENGVYQTTDENVVAWMREHPRFNEVFHEVGNEPDRMLPSVPDLTEQITRALLEGDTAKLSAIIIAEQDTHGREAVLEPAMAALNALAPPSAA